MAAMKRHFAVASESNRRPSMKTWAALISIALVLLPAGVAQSQSMRGHGWSGARGGAPRRPAAQQPGFAQRSWSQQHPGFAQRSWSHQHPGFVRSQSFARSPSFFHGSRFARRVVFVGNQPFFWNGWGWNSWNGWNGWASGWGPGSGVLPYWWPSPPVASAGQSAMYVFCQNPEGFFPYVQDCPGGWIPVAPGPPPAEVPQSMPAEPAPMESTSSADIREQIARSRAELGNRVEVSLETAAGSRPRP